MDIFFYTGRGLPPFISNSSFKALQLALPHFYSNQEIFDKISLPEYVGIQDSLSYLTIRDIMNPRCHVLGGAKPDSITVGIPNNQKITIEEYMSFVNKSKVDIAPSLSEEASLSCGNHRSKRSAKNAIVMLDSCLELKSPALKLLGNIQGGKDMESREFCAKEMKKRCVDGFVIGGIDLEESGAQLRRVVGAVYNGLSGDSRMIVLSGPGRPLDIVYAAQHGITFFESCWPFILAEKGKALDLPLVNFEDAENIEDMDFYEPELDLNDEKFAMQKGALVENCECLTCKQHHRGYIYHLLRVKEMGGNTLLAIHNSFVMKKLVEKLAKAKEEGKLGSVYADFVNKYCMGSFSTIN
ncbi:unnamed protein product [Blepharisma stoltei]|uniref:tRNA-guanine(15) transglycosylase-like domain-containing protein n=1 Tax=Blepharisma stoltei TaxID=1481888 RepID=A0AAU9JQF6_9CILI|nr:unnamed protein product [Blepharisma stoltei]